MSKQKIILFISILILLGGVIGFYFFVINQKVELEPEAVAPEPKAIFEAEVLEDLNSFETPNTETTIPMPVADQTIKDQTQVQAEIDAYVPEKTPAEKTKFSNQEILDLLSDPSFKAY